MKIAILISALYKYYVLYLPDVSSVIQKRAKYLLRCLNRVTLDRYFAKAKKVNEVEPTMSNMTNE